MAVSVFLCRSKAADFFEKLFLPLTFLLKIPKACGGILLSALVGGYPAAAKNINDLALQGVIDSRTAGKMLCYCVNAGPPFLISAIGAGIFGNIKTGFLIFFAQLFSAALIAFFISLFSERISDIKSLPQPQKPKTSVCIVESVVSSAESCFRMCAFIVIACGITGIIEQNAAFSSLKNSAAANAVFSGFFEVTSGCFACADIEGFSSIILAGAIASFSGISVILQIAAVTEESKIPLFPFVISRFFHAGITAGILRIFLLFSKDTAEVFSSGDTVLKAALSASAPAAVSLLCMASLFLLSLVPPESKKEPLFLRIKEKIFLKS
ncbi:MAG: hypothetical protein IJO22_03045 [Oscillospiraceae bacterium]|nr:hypothetical protein [Oscillospiraceae bacterium]